MDRKHEIDLNVVKILSIKADKNIVFHKITFLEIQLVTAAQ